MASREPKSSLEGKVVVAVGAVVVVGAILLIGHAVHGAYSSLLAHLSAQRKVHG